MRILYTAKNKGQNDNEGAIKHALQMLGHDVFFVEESELSANWHRLKFAHQPDLLLFQNWKRPPDISDVAYPKVFWYMDRIDYGDDPILADWTRARKQWMQYILPRVNLGFCTDGDWVARDTTDKLIHLMQGADERFAKPPTRPGNGTPLLFCGTVYGRGEGRASFVRELKDTYGPDFHHKKNLFGHRLINAVHSAQIVLAPDGPISDRYTSNRAVITCSFGGFLLHPACAIMESMYEDGKEVVFYRSRRDLHEKIRYYLNRPEERWAIQQAGYQRTIREHLYRHKLQIILKHVEQRCGVTHSLD